MGKGQAPTRPGMKAFEQLDLARTQDPAAELEWWVIPSCDDEHFDEQERCPGFHGGWKGYVVRAEFLGRPILLGYPSE